MDAVARIDVKELQTMPAGSRLVYHVGFLAEDRGESEKSRTPAQKAVNETANAAWGLHLKGIATLVQKRIAPELYEYIAVRMKRA